MAYVYSHIRKDNGKCFYIGKGTGDRAYRPEGRNKHWHSIVKKAGYEVKMLVTNISDKKAYEVETHIISQ